jgi:hypothetical protein
LRAYGRVQNAAGMESTRLSFFADAQNDKGERRMTVVANQSLFASCAESAIWWNQ